MLSSLLSLFLMTIIAVAAANPAINFNKVKAFNVRALTCLSLAVPLGFCSSFPVLASIDCNQVRTNMRLYLMNLCFSVSLP